MQSAQRYGYTEEKESIGWLAYRVRFQNIRWYSLYENAIRSTGRTVVGLPGEEEGVVQLGVISLGMNAASRNKEGVWQFLQFLLQEEQQIQIGNFADGRFPVHKEAFRKVGELCLEDTQPSSLFTAIEGWEFSDEEFITREQLDSVDAWFEKAEFLPWRTAPILQIIGEETQMYFDGIKSIEEVSAIIENRVRLYLKENS